MPWRMYEGYGSRFVCVSICLSLTALAATYLVYTYKMRRYTVSCRFLQICIVRTLLKTFCSGDVALFVCHDDWRLSSFLTKTTPIILDRGTSGTVYEPLARSDD